MSSSNGLFTISESSLDKLYRLSGTFLLTKTLREITYQVLTTLVYIHENKICHRDIKP